MPVHAAPVALAARPASEPIVSSTIAAIDRAAAPLERPDLDGER